MADTTKGLRRVQISSNLFGGYHTYITLSEFKCECEITDHVKALLTSQLSELNLLNLINVLLDVEFNIYQDIKELQNQKETETIWISDNCEVEQTGSDEYPEKKETPERDFEENE